MGTATVKYVYNALAESIIRYLNQYGAQHQNHI